MSDKKFDINEELYARGDLLELHKDCAKKINRIVNHQLAEKDAEIARLKARELDVVDIINKINNADEQPCTVCNPDHQRHIDDWIIRQETREEVAQAIVDARRNKNVKRD